VTSDTAIACTYDNGDTVDAWGNPLCPNNEPVDTLVVYDTSGNYLYRSHCLFDSHAWQSVPIISSNGDVFLSDDKTVARISKDPVTHLYPSDGGSTWCMDFRYTTPQTCGNTGTLLTKLPGPSISPILLSNGTTIVFATAAPGYIFAFYADDGTFIASKQATGDCSTLHATCFYETRNTPAASYDSSNNRFYVSMDAYRNFGGYANVDGYGLLVALQVNTSTIDIKWSYAFNGPSGASPAVLPISGGSNSAIYFDGYGNNDPRLYKITDTGTTYTANWVSPSGAFAARIPASVTIDTTHTCVWAYALNDTNLKCIDLGNSYALDYTVDTSRFSTGIPASAMTLTTTSGGSKVLILGLQLVGPNNPGKVLAVELVPSGSNFGAQYWIFALPSNTEFAPTQFPLITETSGSNSYQDIAFPSDQHRLYYYGN
jgi:hypothetical protein